MGTVNKPPLRKRYVKFSMTFVKSMATLGKNIATLGKNMATDRNRNSIPNAKDKSTDNDRKLAADTARVTQALCEHILKGTSFHAYIHTITKIRQTPEPRCTTAESKSR